MSAGEEDSSSVVSGDEDYDWNWIVDLKPRKLKEKDLKSLLRIFESWKPKESEDEDEDLKNKLLVMYDLAVGALFSRDSDLQDALQELMDKNVNDDLIMENKELKSQIKKLKKSRGQGKDKNEDEAIEEILQLEQDLTRLKHEYDQQERQMDRERASKEVLESKVESLQKERKSLKREIESLRDEVVDSRRSIEDDETEHQETELRRVRELEESIRLKNKQIHQLLEDVEMVEKDNSTYQENIVNLRDQLADATNQINSMTGEYVSAKESSERLNALIDGLQTENTRLRTLLDDVYDEKRQRDQNLESLGRRVDEKMQEMTEKLQNKDAEIEELRARLYRARINENGQWGDEEEMECQHGSRRMANENISVLTQAVKEREEQIENLKKDLLEATREIEKSASILEDLKSHRKTKFGEDPLEKTMVDLRTQIYEAGKKISQLREDVEEAQEIARTKAEELNECLLRLRSFEKGEYGLEQALDEIKTLKKQLKNSDEQLRNMTQSYNQLQYHNNEIIEENSEYRGKLGLSKKIFAPSTRKTQNSSEETKFTKNRSQERALMQVMQREIERLEEERIFLKTENRKLARQLGSRSAELGLTSEDMKSIQEYTDALKHKRKHVGDENDAIESYKTMRALQEELAETQNALSRAAEESFQFKRKYEEMLEENDSLRSSMREILDSITSQDADSDVKIESCSLDRILNILDARHLWGEYHPAMELKAQLQKLEGNNTELRDQLRKSRRNEERCTSTITKHLATIHNLEAQVLEYQNNGTCVISPPTVDEDTKDPSNQLSIVLSSTLAVAPVSPIPALLTDTGAKLNTQLIHVLNQLHIQKNFNKKLEAEIENLHGTVNVQRHQLGLLYEEHYEKSKTWLQEKDRLNEDIFSTKDQIKKLLIKCEELEKNYDDDETKTETIKKIIILRSNEAIMVRRYRAVEDSEKHFKKEVTRLKEESVEMENKFLLKLGSLQRYKDMASFKIKGLQASLNDSVPLSDLNAANEQFIDLTEKYRNILNREEALTSQTIVLQELEILNETLNKERDLLKEGLSSAKEKICFLESITSSGGDFKISMDDQTIRAQMSKQIATLEMKELNERQKGEHLEKQCKLLQTQISLIEQRNDDLERKFKEVSNANLELQKAERQLQEQVIANVPKEEFDKVAKKLKELEENELALKTERDELKEISDIAANQISLLESRKGEENIELESLRHQVIDLQTQTDEKAIIGKLHRQIISLQVKETDALQKIQMLENRLRKSESQILRQNKKVDECENIIFKIRHDANQKAQNLRKLIQDLRRQYSGSIPLSRHEKIAQSLMDIHEEKRKSNMALRKAEEEKRAAEIMSEELRIRLETLDSDGQRPNENDKLQELRIKELKANRLAENLSREVEYLRKINKIQFAQIDKLETDLVCAQSLKEERISEWSPLMSEGDFPCDSDKKSKSNITFAQKEQCDSENLDLDLPLNQQLDIALTQLRSQSRDLESYKTKVCDEQRLNDELMRKLREAESFLLAKDRTIVDLRHQLPNTVQKALAVSTATGPSGIPSAISEDYESRQALKIAQSTIDSLRKRLQQKEETLSRYENLIRSAREESKDEIRRKDKEIQNMQSRIRVLQSGLNELRVQKDEELSELQSPSRIVASQVKKIRDLEDEILELQRKSAETSEIYSVLIKERDTYLSLAETRRREIEETKERMSPSSSNDEEERISVIQRLNEEISRLTEKLENAAQRENELLLNKSLDQKPQLSYRRQEIEEKDKKIRSLSKVITDLKSEMLNLEHVESMDSHNDEGKNRKIFELSEKNEKLQKSLKSLREKDSISTKEIQSLKRELEERESIQQSVSKQSATHAAKERDALKMKLSRLEQRLEAFNKAERPLENSSDHYDEVEAVEKRIKNAEELAKWNENKKWQGKIESLKTKVLNSEKETVKLNRTNKSLRETISRFERDAIMMRARMKACTDRFTNMESKIDELTEENERHKELQSEHKSSLPQNESIEVLNLKNTFLQERIESQERKIAALEITKNKSKGEEDFILKLSEIQEKEKNCQKQKLQLEEQIIKLKHENETLKPTQSFKSKEISGVLNELRTIFEDEGKEEAIHKIEKYLQLSEDVKPGKFLPASKFQTREKRLKEDLSKLRNMNENLIAKVEEKTQEVCRLEEETAKLRRIQKIRSNVSSSNDSGDDQVKRVPSTEINHETFRSIEYELKCKSDLLAEVKILLKQAAARERSQLAENEELKNKCQLIMDVNPKSSSEILAKELRQTRLTVVRLESEKKELEYRIDIMQRDI